MAEPPTARRFSEALTRAEAARASDRSLIDLVRSAAEGDERAIGDLYERRFVLVYDAARAATGRDEHFCLDVVQESFLRVLRAGPALRGLNDADHVDRWLVRIAQTAALDLLRAEGRRLKRERLASRTLEAGASGETIARLQESLAQLSTEERELLRLRTSGLTLNAIAEAVGTSIGAVHGRLRRLSARLRGSQKEREHE